MACERSSEEPAWLQQGDGKFTSAVRWPVPTSSGALQVTHEPLQVSKAKKNNPVDIFKKEDFSPQPPHFWGKDGQGIEVWEKATTGELKQEDPLGGYHNNLSEKGWQLR